MSKTKFVDASVDKSHDITTLRNGELIQLNDDYILEPLQLAVVSNYPCH